MKLYRTAAGTFVEIDGLCHSVPSASWDELINSDELAARLRQSASGGAPISSSDLPPLLAPVGSQEVWAAGVTYFRSRDARMEEAEAAGAGRFYNLVYSAARPELFFKASAHRVVGTRQAVRIRRDSKWNVPEPELTLMVNSRGKIIGYTIGNDMSSRDIEGENPLYLPQAKIYDGCCALGPAIFVTADPLPTTTSIELSIARNGRIEFEGATTLAGLKRKPSELVEYLFRESSFPSGALLMTGTGIVPPAPFTLAPGDQVQITIDPIGTLINTVIQQ